MYRRENVTIKTTIPPFHSKFGVGRDSLGWSNACRCVCGIRCDLAGLDNEAEARTDIYGQGPARIPSRMGAILVLGADGQIDTRERFIAASTPTWTVN